MNVGDYVRVENKSGAIEGTVTAVHETNFYMKGWAGKYDLVGINLENTITVLKTFEPIEFGTVITATTQGHRGKLVLAEFSGGPAWYMPVDSDGNGGWFFWNELKDVELT